MKTKLLVMIAVMGAMSLPAWAVPVPIDVLIDANGPAAGGSPGLTSSLDWNVGNVLAIGAVPPGGIQVGTNFQTRYQASLSGFNPAGGGPLITPPAGREWTIVAVVPETTLAVVGAFPVATAIFGLGPVAGPASPIDAVAVANGGVAGNTFQIYESAANSSDLAGTGFADGTLVLEATVTAVVSNFTGTGGGSGTDMDQFLGGAPPTDDYPAIDTVTGIGGTNLRADVNFANPLYIANPLGTIDVALSTTQQVLPFVAVEPSGAFLTYVPSLGTVNGLSGPDFQFQIDANGSFLGENRVEVPEPVTAGLGVMGLAGLALAALRRRSA